MSGSAASARRLVRALPVATVATLTTATTLVAALPAHADAANSQPSTASSGVKPAPAPRGTPAPGAIVQPDFGAGKVHVKAEAQPGTFPAGMTVDLSKVFFNVTHPGSSGSNDTQSCDPDATPATPCTAGFGLDGWDGAADSSLWNFSVDEDPSISTLPGGFLAPATLNGTMNWDRNVNPRPGGGGDGCVEFFTLTLSPAQKQQLAAAGARLTAHAAPRGTTNVDSTPEFCEITVTVQLPGTWRPVGLTVTNAKTGKPVAGATYKLNAPALADPAPVGPPEQVSRTATSHAVSSRQVASSVTATSNSAGHLVFKNVYLGAPGYSFSEVKGPAGYKKDSATHKFTLPAITSVANAGKEFDVSTKLSPLPPTLVDDSVKANAGQPKVITVLGNDTAVSAPLTTTSVTQPANGTAKVNPDGTVTYTPNGEFLGTDTFTYRATNALGGTATATVTVTVNAVLGERAQLPFTGNPAAEIAALGLITTGAGLMAFGFGFGPRRRRT
jgi:hypothetical protein